MCRVGLSGTSTNQKTTAREEEKNEVHELGVLFHIWLLEIHHHHHHVEYVCVHGVECCYEVRETHTEGAHYACMKVDDDDEDDEDDVGTSLSLRHMVKGTSAGCTGTSTSDDDDDDDDASNACDGFQ